MDWISLIERRLLHKANQPKHHGVTCRTMHKEGCKAQGVVPDAVVDSGVMSIILRRYCNRPHQRPSQRSLIREAALEWNGLISDTADYHTRWVHTCDPHTAQPLRHSPSSSVNSWHMLGYLEGLRARVWRRHTHIPRCFQIRWWVLFYQRHWNWEINCISSPSPWGSWLLIVVPDIMHIHIWPSLTHHWLCITGATHRRSVGESCKV